MIVNFKYLNKKKIKLVMVDGGFDPLHDGHIRYFQEARKKYKKYKIVCCLANDRYIKRKHKVLLNQERRSIVIDAIKYIDFVIKNNISTSYALNKIKPSYYIKGKEWRNKLPLEEIKVCKKNKIKIVYLNTKKSSSSKILKNYEKKY